MNNLIVRLLAKWFNDGKRLTAIVLIGLQYLANWAAAKGYPLPEGLAESASGYIAAAALTMLSKVDLRVPEPAPKT